MASIKAVMVGLTKSNGVFGDEFSATMAGKNMTEIYGSRLTAYYACGGIDGASHFSLFWVGNMAEWIFGYFIANDRMSCFF